MSQVTPSAAAIVERVLAVYPGAKRILLFGSRARGIFEPDSDYDLLVVAETVLRPALRGVSLRLALRDLRASFDLLVVTPQEFDRLARWKSTVIHHAATEGQILHEAA